MSRCLARAAVASILLLSPACAAQTDPPSTPGDNAPAPAPPGLDVNDVSVLFPLPAANEQDLLLSLKSADTAGAPLLEESVFTSLLTAAAVPENLEIQALRLDTGAQVPVAGPGIQFEDQMRDRGVWRVVSFRFDTCAPMPEQAPCLTQLRLIAQPIFDGQRGFREADVTAHLVFNFRKEGEAERIASELLALKRPETTGIPLGIHPAIAQEGLSGPTAKAYRAFLVSNAALASDMLLALMGLRFAGFEPWVFVAGAVRDDRFVPIAQRLGDAFHGAQAIDFRNRGRIVPPSPLDRISTTPLVSKDKVDLADEDAQRVAVIDNPFQSALLPGQETSPAHRDCASCHSATSALLRIADSGRDAAEIGRFLARPERFRVPEGITGYPDTDALRTEVWSVRNFGHFNRRPALTLRTVNETSVVAADANRRLHRSNPWQHRCDEEAAWRCILNRQAGQTADECLADHCRAPGP